MPGAADPPPKTLTGLWHGQYSYPVATRAPVPFTANLIEAENWLGGSISEHATLGRRRGRALYATIKGQRLGSSVSFMKVYEANSGPYTSVAYCGVLSEDGLEIDGDWTAAGWSGRFLMIRAAGQVIKRARRVAQKA